MNMLKNSYDMVSFQDTITVHGRSVRHLLKRHTDLLIYEKVEKCRTMIKICSRIFRNFVKFPVFFPYFTVRDSPVKGRLHLL